MAKDQRLTWDEWLKKNKDAIDRAGRTPDGLVHVDGAPELKEEKPKREK